MFLASFGLSIVYLEYPKHRLFARALACHVVRWLVTYVVRCSGFEQPVERTYLTDRLDRSNRYLQGYGTCAMDDDRRKTATLSR